MTGIMPLPGGQPIDPDMGAAKSSVVPFPSIKSSLPPTPTETAPKPPTPAYSGPSINSIQHVAESLGATYKTDPATGMTSVNGTTIKPTGFVGGTPHAPVRDVALAAGYPATHVQPTSGGNMQVMPKITPTQAMLPQEDQQKLGAPLPAPAKPVTQPVHQTQPTQTTPPPQVPGAAGAALNLGVDIGSALLGATGVHIPAPQVNTQVPTTQQIPTNVAVEAGVNPYTGQPVGGGSQQASNPAPQVNTPIPTTQQIPTNIAVEAGVSPYTGQPTGGGSQQASNLNPYWTTVQQAGGLWQAPLNGESAAQLRQDLATKFGVNPNVIQIDAKSGHAFIPFQYLQGYAQAHSAAQPTQSNAQPVTASQSPTQANQGPLGGVDTSSTQSVLQAILGLLQQQQAQGPSIAPPAMPQYNFDMGNAAQQAYAAENPLYQQQMQTQDQSINDQMNRRGIYNSGIAQQAVDQANQGINQSMWNAINKDIGTYQDNAIKAYQAQLSAYNDQINAMYKNGQLTNQQYQQALSALNNMATQLVNQQKADQTGQNQQATQMLNYYKTLGYIPDANGNLVPTAQTTNQQTTQALNLAKALGYTVNPNGSITPTLQALNQGGTTYGPGGSTTSTVTSQKLADQVAQWNTQNQIAYAKLDQSSKALAEKEWQALLPYNNMTADQKAQLTLGYAKLDEQTQALQDSMIKAKLPYDHMTAYQQAEITLKQSAQSFTEQLDQVKNAQAQAKITLAQNSEAFKEWAQKQNIDINNTKLSMAQKTAAVNQWTKEESNALSQLKAAQTSAEDVLSNATKQMDTIQANNPTSYATDPNYISAQQQATNAINQLQGLAQQIGSIGTNNLNSAQK